MKKVLYIKSTSGVLVDSTSGTILRTLSAPHDDIHEFIRLCAVHIHSCGGIDTVDKIVIEEPHMKDKNANIALGAVLVAYKHVPIERLEQCDIRMGLFGNVKISKDKLISECRVRLGGSAQQYTPLQLLDISDAIIISLWCAINNLYMENNK